MPYRLPAPATTLELVGLPSRMPWDDDAVARDLEQLEALPPLDRRQAVRARIRDREAELAVLIEAGGGLVDPVRVRTGDERLTGLYLVDTLLT